MTHRFSAMPATPRTVCLWLSALLCLCAPGCTTVMELQDARVLPEGHEQTLVGTGVQIQRGGRISPAPTADEGEQWPLLPVAVELVYRHARGLGNGLQISYQLHAPFVFEGLMFLGGRIGLKAQLLGHDPDAPFALAIAGRIGASVFAVSDGGDSAVVTLGVAQLAMPMSLHDGPLAIYATPKVVFEGLLATDIGAVGGVSHGGTIGARLGADVRDATFLEVTVLRTPQRLTRDGYMFTVGFGRSFR